MEYDESGRASHRYGNTGPGAILNIVSAVSIPLGFLLLSNRLYWRWRKGTPGFDDILIVIAWIFLFLLGIVTMKAVDCGYGRKQSTLTRQEASDAERFFYVYQILYKLTINTCKLSILVLYLRVFDTQDWFGYVTKGLLFIVTTYTFAILIANIFICSPISLYWDTTLPEAAATALRHSKCINILAFWYASSLYNILSESVMLLSVLVRVWTLPSHSHPPILQFRQKVNLTFVLGLGVFTTATAILRMTTLSRTAMTSDKTGGTLRSTIWSSIEAGLGIVVANLPMVRQLLRWRGWCGGRWFSSTAGKSRENSRRRSSRAGNQGPLEAFSKPSDGNGNDSLGTAENGLHIPLRQDFGYPTNHTGRDVEIQGSKSQFVEIESVSSDTSPKSSAHYNSNTRGSGPVCGSIGGITLKGRSDSNAPSFTSTMAATEPVPMVKISSDPDTISLPPQCVRSATSIHLRSSR